MDEAEHEVSYRDEKAPLLRKVIAQRMLESKQTVPHFYLTIDVDVKNLIAFRGELNQGRERKISFNDIIIKAIASMLTKHPNCNVSYIDDNIRYYDAANVCLAVAIDGGLLTPAIRDCANKSIEEISDDAAVLVEKARNKKLRQAYR